MECNDPPAMAHPLYTQIFGQIWARYCFSQSLAAGQVWAEISANQEPLFQLNLQAALGKVGQGLAFGQIHVLFSQSPGQVWASEL